MKPQRDGFALCDQIREASFALQRYLRHGYLAKVYENGLAHRARNREICSLSFEVILCLLRLFAVISEQLQIVLEGGGISSQKGCLIYEVSMSENEQLAFPSPINHCKGVRYAQGIL